MSRQMKMRLFVLGVLVALALATAVIAIDRSAATATGAIPVIVLIAVLVFVAARSPRLRRYDERLDGIGVLAGALAGFALFIAVSVASLVEYARGHSVEPFYWMAALYLGLFVATGLVRKLRSWSGCQVLHATAPSENSSCTRRARSCMQQPRAVFARIAGSTACPFERDPRRA
jgi:hypothetical protein